LIGHKKFRKKLWIIQIIYSKNKTKPKNYLKRAKSDTHIHYLSRLYQIYHISKTFPKEELFSLTDQIRRSSRSVSGNLAEAFRKRKYPKLFVCKLTDVEGEAAETQVWLDYAHECGYIELKRHSEIFDKYDHIISMIVNMSTKPEKWSV